MPTVIVDGRCFELSREQTLAIADHLWQGRRRGAVTSALKLAQLLAPDSAARARAVAFEASEADAVYEALAATGVSDRPAPPAR